MSRSELHVSELNAGGARSYLRLDDAALLAQCAMDTYRAQGPGGQKRNKTSSAVRLRHEPTGLIVVATEERSQHMNKARALKRLRQALALHVRAPEDGARPDAPTAARFRTAEGALRIGVRHEDYLCVVAEVLDVFAALRARVKETADRLGLRTAQLVRFFDSDPKLRERVNQMRAAAGAKPLR